MDTSGCYETRHGRHEALGTHRHRHAYAALVLEGSYVECSVDGPVPCEPGLLVMHPGFHVHGNRFGAHGARVINLELAGEPADHRFGAWHVPQLAEASAVFRHAAAQLEELIAASQPVASVIQPSWQSAFMDELQRSDLPVHVLARRAGVSAAHASRALLKSHGMPPQLLRRELRWRRALELLREPLSLADVAINSGFADQSHLTRTARASTGYTPRQLRQQIKCVQDRAG
jgi:transcriptional regulator GlxA family with amidase domain